MLLAIDIGNSNLTAGLVHGEAVVASRRAATRLSATADELEMLIDDLLRLDGGSLSDVTGISLASVVPDVARSMEAMAERRGLQLLTATAAIMPMPVRADRPAEVGVDRLINALGVAKLYGTPAIVVDFGTATKFDCVARDGGFVGGAIAPGLRLGMEALAARTAKLPRVDLAEPKKAIGGDTVAALQSGIMLGYRAMTLGMIDRIRLELARTQKADASSIQVVLTGGLSQTEWARSLPGVDAVDPELTLKGLAILWAMASGAPDVGAETGWVGSAAGSIHVISEANE
jgi:type III pantothenate kinase